jgi:hypothetical protein
MKGLPTISVTSVCCCSCRWEETCLRTAATNEPTVHQPGEKNMYNHGGMILTEENHRTRRKTCLIATMSTTNPTWTDPGLRGERPATKCLSHTSSGSIKCDTFLERLLSQRNVRNSCLVTMTEHLTIPGNSRKVK